MFEETLAEWAARWVSPSKAPEVTMDEIAQLKHRIESLESAIYDAYDLAGQRGKGACAAIRHRLRRFAAERDKRFSDACDEALRLARKEPTA